MDKRSFIGGLAATIPFIVTANAAENKNSASWKVPPGVKKIRVRSWNSDGSKDMDRTLNVEPGQVFRLDAIEE